MKISVYILGIIIILYLLFLRINIPYLALDNHKLIKKKANLFFVLTTLTLIAFSALRGDFATDYTTYIYQIQIYVRQGIRQVLQARDVGFALIMRSLYMLNNNGFICIAVLSIATVLAFSFVIKRDSKNWFLSFVVFVALDSYIISFNLMRNILAVSLVLCSIRLIWDKKLIKYLISILLISLIHRSALVMIPMYWLLQKDYRKRKNAIILVGGIALLFVAFAYTRQISLLGQAFIGMNYTSYDNFGLDFGNIGSALKTTMMMGYILFSYKKLNYNDNKNVVYVNMCIFAWAFQLLAARVLMFQRVGYYFSTAFIIIIPNLIDKSKNKKLISIAFVGVVFLYVVLFQNVTDYYWVWENKRVIFW